MATSLPVRSVGVLVPVKAFADAKGRLSSVLDAAARAELAREMATRVVRAAQGLPVSVVCDDGEVARWAVTVGADVIWRPGRGLNGAVNDGVDELARQGIEDVIVTHADLPGASDLTPIAGFKGVTLVPDRHRDGTNVLCIPARSGFLFAYGPGSFARHRLETVRLGLDVRIVDEPRLAWDIDTPDDLNPPRELHIPEPISIPLGSISPRVPFVRTDPLP